MCLYPLFLSTRPSDRNQILHTYSDRYGTHSHLNKFAPCMARKAGLIGNNLRKWTLAAWGRYDLGPTAWNCHLHPSLRFSGSSYHLIHAFLAVASLGNLCPPKLLHLGTQHSVPRLFLLRLSMPPTATHQQDNSYGGSAIWRVSKFVIPLIELMHSWGLYYSLQHITNIILYILSVYLHKVSSSIAYLIVIYTYNYVCTLYSQWCRKYKWI